MKKRNFALASSALTALLLLAGCSAGVSGMGGMTDDPSNPSDSSTTFNDADVDFAVNMTAHHQQAIEMADLVLGKDGVDEKVVTLALAIKEAQGPEIDTMTTWLESWGQGAMSGMDHGGGMMSDDDMAALENATGAEASTLFLQQMIEHHQGAITMAGDEVSQGANPDATALAQKIIDAQTSEIATMQDLLGGM